MSPPNLNLPSNEVIVKISFNDDFKIINYQLNNRFDYTYENCLSSGECLTYIPQVNFLEEIDYHDFENTNKGKFYNDIKIVNITAVDVYDI